MGSGATPVASVCSICGIHIIRFCDLQLLVTYHHVLDPIEGGILGTAVCFFGAKDDVCSAILQGHSQLSLHLDLYRYLQCGAKLYKAIGKLCHTRVLGIHETAVWL